MNPFEELQQLVEQAQEERRLLQMGHKPVGDSLTAAAAILGRINTLIRETQAAKALAEAKLEPVTEPQAEPTPVVAPVVAPVIEPEQAVVKVEPEPPPSADPVPTESDTPAKRKTK